MSKTKTDGGRLLNWDEKRLSLLDKKCLGCGEIFQVEARLWFQKYCSRGCRDKVYYRKSLRKTIKCVICGVEHQVNQRNNTKTCGHEHATILMAMTRYGMTHEEVVQKRKEFFEKNANRTCKICGKHIAPERIWKYKSLPGRWGSYCGQSCAMAARRIKSFVITEDEWRLHCQRIASIVWRLYKKELDHGKDTIQIKKRFLKKHHILFRITHGKPQILFGDHPVPDFLSTSRGLRMITEKSA